MSAPPDPRPPTGIRDIDPPPPPSEILLRYGARVLDPVEDDQPPGPPRLPDGPPRLHPTAYIADTLLFRLAGLEERLGALRPITNGEFGVDLVPDPDAVAAARLLDDAIPASVPVRLVRPDDKAGPALDAWPVLMALRAALRAANQDTSGISLNHLLTTAAVMGTPNVIPRDLNGTPNVIPRGLYEYVLPGSGGRAPVAYLGPKPQPKPDATLGSRRPVVAVVDTGVGANPWLGKPSVLRDDQDFPSRAGLPDTVPDPEVSGDEFGPMDGVLDAVAGHGTFICGLIRQVCPDATVVAVRVMRADGVAKEEDLVKALQILLQRHLHPQGGGSQLGLLDVVVLSLGYYHETPEDAEFDSSLLPLLTALGAAGVAVVAAAGNDATLRPLFPAAFTPAPGGLGPASDPAVVPVVGVGGRNPDGTVALFSNSGTWVTAWDRGAALVSTFPTTFNGGAMPSVELADPSGQVRRTMDPDSYVSGFGTWSGTSFAAPVYAARLAQALLDGPSRQPPAPALDAAGMGVQRARSAMAHVTSRPA